MMQISEKDATRLATLEAALQQAIERIGPPAAREKLGRLILSPYDAHWVLETGDGQYSKFTRCIEEPLLSAIMDAIRKGIDFTGDVATLRRK